MPVSSDVVDDRKLQLLANDIVKEWQRLGRALGLKDGDLDQIKADSKQAYERNYAMLQKWKRSKGHEATYEALALALTDKTVQRRDLADRYCYGGLRGKKNIVCRVIQEFAWSSEILIPNILDIIYSFYFDYIISKSIPFKGRLFCQNPM